MLDFYQTTPYIKIQKSINGNHNMRVLLVSANTEKINMPVLPLGLACVAEAARSAGHNMKLVDLMDQQDTWVVIKNDNNLSFLVINYMNMSFLEVKNIDVYYGAASYRCLKGEVKQCTGFMEKF